MPVRVLDADGEGATNDIARGIDFASKKGADIINLSFEFHVSVGAADVPAIAAAIRRAQQRGVLIVGAAGNQEEDVVAYPARSSRVMAVGATTEHGCKADYSDTGADLDITAPGGGGDAVLAGNAADDANCAGNRERSRDLPADLPPLSATFDASGSRTATAARRWRHPHVAGAAALVIATKRLGKDPAPQVVAAHLQRTARDLGPVGPDPLYGFGLLDAAQALR